MNNFEKQFEQIVEKLDVDVRPNAEHKKTLRQQMLEACNKSSSKTAPRLRPIWSRFMKSNFTKSAAAAIIVVGGIVCLTLSNLTIPKAYALKDTIKAYNSIRWLHIYESYAFTYGAPRTSEIWLECDERGKVKKLRFESENVGEPVGSLVFVGDSNRSEAWLARYNLRLTGYGELKPNIFLRYDISELNPRLLFERLFEQQNQGEAIVDIEEPTDNTQPIIVTVTYPEKTRSQMWKKVMYVEKATKLVTKIEKYEFRSQGFELIKTLEFLDYNQPIDASMFVLSKDLPSDAEVVDLSQVEAGMLQGDMTEKEVAEKITREFFEAVMAKDYSYAGQLYLAAPGFMVEQAFMGANILKIISIGPAHRDPDPDSDAVNCSCKVLAERNGQYYEINAFMIRIIKADTNENRWIICGMAIDTAHAYGLMHLSSDHQGLSDATYDDLLPGKFMQKWLVLGPLPYPVQQDVWFASKEGQQIAFDTDIVDPVHFVPMVTYYDGIDESDMSWSLLKTNTHAIDLNQLDADVSDFKVAYLWAQVDVPEDRTVTLAVGSDDGVKIWLNGELVHANWLYREVVEDDDLVQVTFKKGTNQLLVKVQNALGPWGFCCRVLDK